MNQDLMLGTALSPKQWGVGVLSFQSSLTTLNSTVLLSVIVLVFRACDQKVGLTEIARAQYSL